MRNPASSYRTPRFVRHLAASALVLCTALTGAQAQPLTAVPFEDSLSTPYGPVGLVIVRRGTKEYVASASAIASRSVIGCAHILYHPATGWATNVRFEYGRYNDEIVSTNRATNIYVLAGYRENTQTFGGNSSRAFARDIGGIVCQSITGLEGVASWVTQGQAPIATTGNKMTLGYGGVTFNGDTPLYASTASPFQPVRGCYYFNPALNIEGGMSGGPLMMYMGREWHIVAINVSGGANGTGTGVRALNFATERLIKKHLSK